MGVKVRARLLAALAYAGIGLVMLAIFGKSYGLTVLVIPGFALLIVGGFGLIGLSRRESLRRVTPAPSTPPSVEPPSAPLQRNSPPGPSTLPDSRSDFGSSLLTASSLEAPVTFDLTTQYQAYRARMRYPVLFRMFLYVLLIAFGGYSIVEGIVQGRAVLLGVGAAFSALGACLLIFVRGVGRGTDALTVGPAGITARLVPGPEVRLLWNDPRFGLKLIVTSADVNRATNSPAHGPTYRLFFGVGSGMSAGPRVLTDIPEICFRLIIAQARAHKLHITDRVEGPIGTVSERRVCRISAHYNNPVV